VEWHEGRIWVEDAEPLGARFVIELAGWRGLSTSPPTAALEARR
jgi:signal transduction histidine kinase